MIQLARPISMLLGVATRARDAAPEGGDLRRDNKKQLVKENPPIHQLTLAGNQG
jgi:hypothetical protein